MRPTIDAALIAHLRQRVIEHNEAHPDAKTKLGDLRKVYERNFRRANPGVRALQKVEEHLGDLAKAEFEEDEHPRDRSGEFEGRGGTESAAGHRTRQANDAGYRAMTSEVVPDNRHEASGAVARNAVSVGATAAVLGTLAASKPGGRLSRKAGNAAAAVGGRFGERGAKAGRKLGEGVVNSAGRTVRSLLRVKQGSRLATGARRAGAFGLLSLAGGMAIRSQWKDSWLDPASVGRTMDAYSYRTIEKAAASTRGLIVGSAELGQARIALTEMLAKNGPAGGSIENLRTWLEQGGGELSDFDGELAKGVPWGKATIRLFSTVAGLGGGTAGSALGYGVARATETAPAEGGDFEDKHPRDDHGRFSVKSNTNRAHRFAQVGGLLGGAAAALATHRAMSNYNVRTNLERDAGLLTRFGRRINETQNYAIGAAKAAKANEKARVEELISPTGTHDLFKPHRKRLAEIARMSPSAVGPMRVKITNAYHRELAERLSQVSGDHDIPTKDGWKKLSDLTWGKKIDKDGVTPAAKAFGDALNLMHTDQAKGGELWNEMLERMGKTGKLRPKVADGFTKLRNEGRVAAAKVKVDLAGHSKAVEDGERAVAKLKKPLDKAKEALADAQGAEVGGALSDDATKATLAEATKAARATHKKALQEWEKAADALDELKQNPVGVRDPKTKEPILPPSEADISTAKSEATEAANAKARKVAEKIAKDEVEAIKDRQVKQLTNALQRRQILAATSASRTGLPKRARAAGAHLQLLTAKADVTEQKLAAANLRHVVNDVELKRLESAMQTRKDKKTGELVLKTPPGMSEAEAQALRLRGGEIRAQHSVTALKLSDAEAAHVKALTDQKGALATYNETMRALPPSARAWLDHVRFSPETSSDIARMRREIGQMVGDYVKSPSGKKLKALYDKIYADTVKHGKAAGEHTKNTGGKILKDLFTRDDPTAADPNNWRVDYSKVLPALTIGGALVGFSQEDLITHIQRRFGSEESRERAGKKKLHIDNKRVITDPRTGRGYWTMHMDDPNNPNDKVVLVGNTFEDSRGKTKPLTTGSSLSAVRQAMVEEEERRKKNEKGNGGNGGGSSQGHGMPKMGDEERKTANAAVSALTNKRAIEEVGTYEGGPTFHVRKADFKAEGDLEATISRGVGAVNTTLREKHNLKAQSPGGEDYHTALSALFSEQAKVLNLRQKYQALTGYTPEGQKAKNFSILKANDGYGGTPAEVLKALSAEVDRVTQHNAPAGKAQQQNLMRALAVVAYAKDLQGMQPLIDKVNAAVAGPAATAATPAASTAVSSPPRPPPTPIDIDAPTKQHLRARWDTSTAWHVAAEHSGEVAKKLGVDNPTMTENLPVIIAGMAGKLQNEGFTEREAVLTIVSVMNELATSDKYRAGAREAMRSADRNPEDVLWNRYLKGPVNERIEAKKKQMENSADHALDHLEQLVKVSMGGAGGFLESLHPRASAGTSAGGEFIAQGAGEAGGGHGGVSPGARIAGEAAEAGTLAYRKYGGGNGSSSNETLEGEVAHRRPEQSWAHPVRFGNEFGSALGFDTGMVATNAAFNWGTKALGTLLPEFKGLGLIGTGLGLVAGTKTSELFSEGGEAAGKKAYSLATGRRAPEYQAPEAHGIGSMVASTGGNLVGGMVGAELGGAAASFAGRAVGGTLGAVAGPVGSALGGAALGYAGGKIYEGIYDYFAGYDKPAVTRAMNRFGAKKAG